MQPYKKDRGGRVILGQGGGDFRTRKMKRKREIKMMFNELGDVKAEKDSYGKKIPRLRKIQQKYIKLKEYAQVLEVEIDKY